MVAENPDTVAEESPLIASAPAHVRLTQKQRRALIFLALVAPLWIVLSLLLMANRILMLAFLGGLFLLVVIYGMRTEYLLFLWFVTIEYNEVLKWILGVQILGVGIKGLFFVAVLTQLPNKFSLMPRKLFRTVPLRWPFYLILLWVGASVLWSDYPFYGLNRYLTWVMTFLIYAMVFLTINDRNKRLFFIVFAVLVGTSVLFGFLQSLGLGIAFVAEEALPGVFQSEYWVGGAGLTMFRATGFAGHPNTFGRECILFFCVLLLMLISWRPGLFWRIAIIGMLGLTLATVVLSYSRMAWMLFAAGTLTFLLFARPRWLIVMAIAAGIVALIAWPQIWARLEPAFSGTDASLAMRGHATRVYMEHWRLQPITGYGFGSTGGGALFEARIWPHEGYVFLLSQLGLIGLFLYLFLLLGLLKHAFKVTRDLFVRADPELRAMAALGFSLAVVAALNLVVAVEFRIHTWYLLGASFGALRIAHGRYAQSKTAVIHDEPLGAARLTKEGKALQLGER